MFSNGQWGISSNIISTKGSTNYACVGLVSSSKTSAQIQQEAQDRANAAAKAAHDRHVHTVLGVTLGVGIPAVLAIAALIYWCRRRGPRKAASIQGIWDDQDTLPRAWQPPTDAQQDTTEMREVDAASQYVSSTRSKTSGLGAPDSPTSMPLMQVTPIPPVYFDREIEAAARGHGSSASNTSNAASASSPGSSSGDYFSQPRPTGASSDSTDSARTRKTRQPASPRPQRLGALPSSLVNIPLDPDTQPDIIIQHRDGGSGIVQELPPPYVDRSTNPTPPPPPPASDTHDGR